MEEEWLRTPLRHRQTMRKEFTEFGGTRQDDEHSFVVFFGMA